MLADVLFNNLRAPNGSNTNMSGGTIVNSQVAYVASTTSTGRNPHNGIGRVLVVDISNPASLSVLREVQIPGTVQVLDVAIQGNRALVVGSSDGWRNPFNGFADLGLDGNLTLTMLDISNPQNPLII